MTESSPKPTRQFRGKLTRTSLLLLLPLTLIPVTILGIITLANTYSFLRDQIITQYINVGDKQEELIDASIKDRETFLDVASKDSTFQLSLDNLLENTPDSTEFQNAYDNVQNNYQRLIRTQDETFFTDFLVVSPDKEIVFATYRLWQGIIMDQNSFDELFSKPGSIALFHVFPFYTEEFSDQFLVFSSQPVFDDSGNQTATLIGITGPSLFQRILELGTLSYAETRPYFITASNQESAFVGLSSTTGELTSFNPSVDHVKIVIPQILTTNEGILEYQSFDNQSVLGFTKWLPSINTTLVLEAPQSVISEPLQKSAFLQITLLAIALIVLGVVIWQGTRRIVQPILQVSQTAQNFADGDLEARAPITRNDEIGLLANSFNQVADQLVTLYRSLENQVEQRTEQIRVAAEVAQISTSSDNMDEILTEIVELLVERFGYYHAAIYMLDRSGDHVILRQAAGEAAQEFTSKRLRIAVGSRSIVGNVAATNQPRVAHDVKQDPYYLEIEALRETKSEVTVPLSVGDRVFGVLDIQSNELKSFDKEEISTLQTLAGQIASALRNFRLLENTKIDLQSTNLLYQTSHQLANVTSTREAIGILANIFNQSPYIWATFIFDANQLKRISQSAEFAALHLNEDFSMPVSPEQIEKFINSTTAWDLILTDNPPADLGAGLLDLANEAGCQAFILLPLMSGDHFTGLILLGSNNKESMNKINLEPYYSIAEMINTSLEKITAIEGITQRYSELQSLSSISQAISTETELTTLFEILHRQIIQAMGVVNFSIALYDTNTEMIEIPYMTEGEQIINLPKFPLGQGLTSIVIRSQQPLMIVDNTVSRTRALGAIITGDKPAKSWLGVPMVIAGEVVGAIVVQDTEMEYRFDDDDLRLLTTLAGQVAPIIRNTRLLAEAQATSERDRQLYEITDNIRQATSFQSIIEITTRALSSTLNLKKAKIEILADPPSIAEHDNGSEEKKA